eukprot:g340.t1
MHYPMELISFNKFQQHYGPGGMKKRLEPHQVLKERGDLVSWESICDDEDTTIIFISHEWLAWDDPDKDNIQTHTLCEALRRLKEGKVDKVGMSQYHQLIYKQNVSTSAEEWVSLLKKTYLWFDWLSMPQPGAEKTKEKKDALKKAGSDAIRSIPAYVERSDFTIILAPYGMHENRKSRAYYKTWRTRGWCVLELFASFFSRDSKYPNLLIRSGEGTPQWIPSFDALMLSCGNCNFSCCERDHVSTTATDEAKGVKINEPISCDKPIMRSAGHGDKIAVVDCNFPAREVATKTTTKTHVELVGVDVPEAVDAMCELLPLDYFIECPAEYMIPSPGNDLPPLAIEVHDALKGAIGKHSQVPVSGLERFAFYEAARESFAVVQCGGERRPYGNVILTKGVVGPDGGDLRP